MKMFYSCFVPMGMSRLPTNAQVSPRPERFLFMVNGVTNEEQLFRVVRFCREIFMLGDILVYSYGNSMERCRSGLTGTPGKRVYLKGYREFESLPLRL